MKLLSVEDQAWNRHDMGLNSPGKWARRSRWKTVHHNRVASLLTTLLWFENITGGRGILLFSPWIWLFSYLSIPLQRTSEDWTSSCGDVFSLREPCETLPMHPSPGTSENCFAANQWQDGIDGLRGSRIIIRRWKAGGQLLGTGCSWHGAER